MGISVLLDACSTLGSQKQVSEPQELKLEMTMSLQVGTEKWNQFLCQSRNECS